MLTLLEEGSTVKSFGNGLATGKSNTDSRHIFYFVIILDLQQLTKWLKQGVDCIFINTFTCIPHNSLQNCTVWTYNFFFDFQCYMNVAISPVELYCVLYHVEHCQLI